MSRATSSSSSRSWRLRASSECSPTPSSAVAPEPPRSLEQIGDGAAHADQAGPGLEYRAHARAVALARGIERAQRLELRALRHVPESRVAERRLGGGQLGFADGQRGLEPIALGAE